MIYKIDLSKEKMMSSAFSLLIVFSFIRNIGDYRIAFVYYGLLACFCCRLLLVRRWQLPPQGLMLFLAYVLLVSLLSAFTWGINQLIENYLIGYLVVVTLFCTLGRSFDEDGWVVIYKRVAVFLMVASYVNLLVQFDAMKYFFQNASWMGHPSLKTFTGGGVNIDATWLAILGIALYKEKKRWVYWALSMLFAAVTASRVGIICNIICLGIFMWGSSHRKRGTAQKVIPVFVGLVLLVVFAFSGMLDNVISRFVQIGEDNGSIGRLQMWKYVPDMVKTYPFGVGIGNVIDALHTVSPLTYWEDNIHCIPIQWLCELGFIGLAFYIYLVGVFLKREGRNVLKRPFSAMLLAYILISLLQFRGGEALLFCILGTYLSIDKRIRVMETD